MKTILKLTVLAVLMSFAVSCSSNPDLITGKEISPFLEKMKNGERQSARVIGKLEMYDHKNLKGQGLWQITIGECTMLMEGNRGKNFGIQKSHLNKTVEADIEVILYPLPAKKGEPIMQKAGHWVTKIKNIKVLDN